MTQYTSDLEKADRTSEAGVFPEVILIDNQSACNLQCSICDHKNIRKYRAVKAMDLALYKRIIDEIAIQKPDARVWLIFFGEPCLCKDMDWRIQYAKKKGLTDVVLNSNGVLLDENKIHGFITSGLDALYVGIDAATKETYQKIRVGGDFDRVIKNVLKYRDSLKSDGNAGQQLFVQFVVSDSNAHEVHAFKRFWKQEGVHVKIRPKVSWAGLIPAENLRINADVERKPCYWLMRTMSICADGNVALCAVDVHCRVNCGNVLDHSIKQLWQASLHQYRKLHREHAFEDLPDVCRCCSDWQSAYAEFEMANIESRCK